MSLGRLPRGLAVAAISAVTVVPLAASAAAAAPAAPTAYTVYGSAEPLFWRSSSSVPVGEIRVPFVWGKTNNLAVADSGAVLGLPDGNTTKPMSGEAIAGLKCTGYDEKACKDPFIPVADVGHRGPDPARHEQAASFGGKDGKFPGRISAITDCGGNCGDQLVRSTTGAAAPRGEYPGYVSVGSSSASHDLSIDDNGRLVSVARSALENVVIGTKPPKGDWPIEFATLETTAYAFGTGAENAKDGRADLRITGLKILGNPVEVTGAGLRLATNTPSEQEAYDGAKHLLERLRKDHGIVLELPDFEKQVEKSPAHVAVKSEGLRVRFEHSVGSVNTAISYPLELGRSTAVVAALDADRNIEVKDNRDGGVTVETTAPTSAPAAAPAGGGQPDSPRAAPPKNAGGTNSTQPPATTGSRGGGRQTTPATPATGGPTTPAAPAVGEEPAESPAPETGLPAEPGVANPPTDNPGETALSLSDVERKLGLRDARSVSRAFGAFLGLGLILPLARFVIRRLG